MTVSGRDRLSEKMIDWIGNELVNEIVWKRGWKNEYEKEKDWQLV